MNAWTVTGDVGYLFGGILFVALGLFIMLIASMSKIAKHADRAAERSFERHLRSVRPLGLIDHTHHHSGGAA